VSRKRQLKKERSRLGALEMQLEHLARLGDDEGFLEAARGRAGELTPAMVELYGKVADRALESALAGADLPRLERLLSRLGRSARARRLGPLAEAVTHLAAGRLEEARAGLAAVDPAAASVPPRLLGALAALNTPGGEVEDLGDPDGVRAVRRFSQALDVLRAVGFRPPPAGLEELSGAVVVLAASLPPETAPGKLLQQAQELLRLLGELAGLEEELSGRTASGLLPFFLERLRGLDRSLLAVFRAGPPAVLLQPLHYALRLRWRALLELVASQGDDAARTRLWEASPALFAFDLELAGPPEQLRNRASLCRLQETRAWWQLAGLLGRLAGAEKAPERVALLWGLELWAWERAAAAGRRGDEEDGGSGGATEPAPHAALVRLSRMAAEISVRLPSGHRQGAARFLKERLFDLCEAQHFCSHMMDAADALLKLLPEDGSLLAVALAGAACSNDARAQRLFASRIAARGPVRREDRMSLLGLLEQIVLEDARSVVPILPSLRLLTGEEVWPEVQAMVAGSVTGLACVLLEDLGGAALPVLRGELAVYRPVLAGRSELAVLEAALACVGPGSAGPPELKKLLARTADLPADLIALRVLAAAGPDAPDSVRKAFEHARDAVLSRLDLRWRLWQPALSILVIGATRSQVRRLRERIEGLLRQDGLEGEDRQALEKALAVISDMQRFERLFRRGSTRQDRKPRRQRSAGDQLNIDLF
jgi:hypothetical protein